MNSHERTALHKRIGILEQRLNGCAQIDEKKDAGQDVTKLEDFWIELLHEYEAACDELAGAGAEKGRAA